MGYQEWVVFSHGGDPRDCHISGSDNLTTADFIAVTSRGCDLVPRKWHEAADIEGNLVCGDLSAGGLYDNGLQVIFVNTMSPSPSRIMVTSVAPSGFQGLFSGVDPAMMMDPPVDTPAAARKAAESNVEALMERLEKMPVPQLTEALLYKHLYNRGQRIDGMGQRLDDLARRKL